jgi:hypothetical protein
VLAFPPTPMRARVLLASGGKTEKNIFPKLLALGSVLVSVVAIVYMQRVKSIFSSTYFVLLLLRSRRKFV